MLVEILRVRAEDPLWSCRFFVTGLSGVFIDRKWVVYGKVALRHLVNLVILYSLGVFVHGIFVCPLVFDIGKNGALSVLK